MKTLTEVLGEHRVGHIYGAPAQIGCLCGWRGTFEDHPAHVAAAYREARTIRDRDTLDALSIRTVIRDDDGEIYERERSGPYLRWYYPGPDDAFTEHPELPALLLWLPEEAS